MSVWKLILKTFSFSVLLSIIVLLIYSAIRSNNDYDSRVIPLICVGCVFLTLIMTIASFPGVLIARAINRNGIKSFTAYFLIPVIALISVLVSSLQDGDKQLYFIVAAAYTLVSGFFYFKSQALKNIAVESPQAEEPV